MPSRSPDSRLMRDERNALAAFVACALIVAGTWLFGISLRAPLWGDDLRLITDPGMSKFFPRISGMMTTALIIAIASAAYLGCLWALHRGFPRSYQAALVATVVAAAAWLPSATLSSPDAVHLAADVRTFWLHGEYPARFSGRPDAVNDPIAQQVKRFPNRPSGYGPVAYAIGGAPLPFVGDSIRANLLGQKIVSATFLVIVAGLAGWVARRLGHNAGLAAGIVGLNPMMLWQFPGDAHNDTIMAAFGLLALPFLLSTTWRQRSAGLLFGAASVLAKFGLAVAAPIVVAHWFPRWRALLAAVAALAGVAWIAVVIIASKGFGFGTIGPATEIAPITPWDILYAAADRDPDAKQWINTIAYGLFVFVLAAIIWKHPLETAEDVVTAAATTTFFFLFLCSPGFLPWYQVWYLPLAAVSGRRWLVATAVLFSIGAFLPLLAFNWRPFIERQMDISDPIPKAVAVLWLATGLTAALIYRNDTRQPQAEAATRRARRAAPRRAIRQRR